MKKIFAKKKGFSQNITKEKKSAKKKYYGKLDRPYTLPTSLAPCRYLRTP